MNIGIIGTGRVGSALAQRWRALGHDILFGARNPNSEAAKAALAQVSGARIGSLRDAATFGEVVLIAVPGIAVPDAVRACGSLRGKIVIDATNWFGERPEASAPSVAEEIARLAPGARVVKCFNTTGTGNMLDPRYGAQKADMFLCGDDADAKAVVHALASGIGFDVIDVGPLSAAALLEHLAQLWVHLAYRQGLGPNIAWKLLRR